MRISIPISEWAERKRGFRVAYVLFRLSISSSLIISILLKTYHRGCLAPIWSRVFSTIDIFSQVHGSLASITWRRISLSIESSRVDVNAAIRFGGKSRMNPIVSLTSNSLQEEEIEELIEVLKKNYNGYLFSKDCSTRLFNSDMILYYLKTYVEKRKEPEELIDKNIASDYGKELRRRVPWSLQQLSRWEKCPRSSPVGMVVVWLLLRWLHLKHSWTWWMTSAVRVGQ